MIRAIVTDIEGTTTDIAFVHKILFPYARERLHEFVQTHQDDPLVIQVMADVRQEINDAQASIEQVIATLESYSDADYKFPPLKTLQGMIWHFGYTQRDFTAHLYPDVYPKLQQWHTQQIALYVYSSGSIAAQKLLFGYSDAGDLTPLFDGYFDTQVGHKRDISSYQTIAQHIGIAPDELLFLSDIHQELDAAKAAGWQTIQLIRNNPDPISQHQQVHSFVDILKES